MNIPGQLLASGWTASAWLLWLLVAGYAIWRAPWGSLRSPGRFSLWLGMIVMLSLIWNLKAGVRPGLELHLVGAALFMLCFGPWLALIGLGIVHAVVCLNGGGAWTTLALNSLLTTGVGVGASYASLRLAERWLPQQLFVYIFANGFFGTGISIFSIGLASAVLMSVAGAYPLAYLQEEYLPYFWLLGFSEAWLTGTLITLFVVYRPAWVVTFDDASYLRKQ